MNRDFEQLPAAGPPLAVLPESETPDAEKFLADAKSLLVAIQSALGSRNPEQARAALNALLQLPILPGPTASQMAQYVSAGANEAARIQQISNEEEIELDSIGQSAATPKSPYRGKKAQSLVLSKLSPDIQDYFNNELQGEMFGPAKAYSTTINGQVVELKPLNGDDVRTAFIDINAHCLCGKEREEVRQALGQGEDMPPEETQNLRQSLRQIRQLKVNQIVEGPGTEQEKAEKLERLDENIREAETRIAEVEQAERAVQQVEQETEQARRNGRQPPPEGMRSAVRRNREERRDALAESLENGVVRESVMEQQPERSRSRGSLPPPSMQQRGQGAAR